MFICRKNKKKAGESEEGKSRAGYEATLQKGCMLAAMEAFKDSLG